MNKLKCTLEILHDKIILLRVDNVTLWDKVIELETKLAKIRNTSSNL